MTGTTAMILGGISAAGALGGSAINALSQRSANKTNVDLMREQMAYNTNERLETQKYNTPAAQRERYQQAGINPYLALTQMDSGNTTAQSAPGAPSVQPVNYGDMLKGLLQEGANGYQKGYELEQYQLGTEQMRVDARYKLTQKLLDISEQRLRVQNSSLDSKAKAKEIAMLDTQAEQMQRDLEFTNATQKERIAIQKKAQVEQDLRIKGAELANDYQLLVNSMQPKQLELLCASISEARSRINLNGAYAASALASKALSLAEEKGVRIDNFQKNKINYLIREGVKLDNRAKRYNIERPSYFEREMFAPFSRGMNQITGNNKETMLH